MAEIDIVEDRAEAARARLVLLLDRPGLEECDVTVLLPVLAWAYLELGQVDLAENMVEQALRRARRETMCLVLVEALRVKAMIALRRGQQETTTHSLEEGLELARSMAYPYAEARLLYVYRLLHEQNGWLKTVQSHDALLLHTSQHLNGSSPRRRSERYRATAHARSYRHRAATAAVKSRATAAQGGTTIVLRAHMLETPGEEAIGRPAVRRMSQEERTQWVLSCLRNGGLISPSVYARTTGVDRRTALRDLQALVGRGLITAYGTTKDRRYALRPGQA
jgi:hypothetical protein